jgi:hypothetical protein
VFAWDILGVRMSFVIFPGCPIFAIDKPIIKEICLAKV